MAEHQITCAGCGAQFTCDRRRKYCQPLCYPSAPRGPVTRRCACGELFAAKTNGIKCKNCRSDKYRQGGNKNLRREDRPEPCEGCGSVMALYKGLCNPCMKIQKQIRETYSLRKLSKRTHLPPILLEAQEVEAVCHECEAHFKYKRSTQYSYEGCARKFCSVKCQRKANARIRTRKRRAVAKGVEAERIDFVKVFQRDGWRCGICGCKTMKAKRGTTHERAPELDHIVAIANGGPHTWDNVQCACRACNSRKGATDYGQIPLFPMG